MEDVYLLIEPRGRIEGVYAFEDDAEKDREYLSNPTHRYTVQRWTVDYQTVAVDPE